jgi:beta-galactosidase
MLVSKIYYFLWFLALLANTSLLAQTIINQTENNTRQRISLNDNWRFYKYDSITIADNLIYDVRPEVTDKKDDKAADSKPTEAIDANTTQQVLKSWILPTGNDFINEPKNRYTRPEGNPGSDFKFVTSDYDDSSWAIVDLPHDWAINGPFMTGDKAEVGGGMGRLPVNGVAWYRKKLNIPASDEGKSIFLDFDGAMSYAMVWLNGQLVGGWPYGYASWRVNLTPYVKPGQENQLAIRLDNPNNSSRWFPCGGIYRNVWLIKTSPIHIGQWGTYIKTRNISKESATLDLAITIDNDSKTNAVVDVNTQIYALNSEGNQTDDNVAHFETLNSKVKSGKHTKFESSIILKNPRLWGPLPTQQPNLYLAVTTLSQNGKTIDQYYTRFGIRSIEFNPDKGVFINGEHIFIKGVNLHHDLGALGAAFNTRAAERQLEILHEMGCNAIRTSHNLPAPELLELTDRMGFLVLDEIFDSWELKKTPLDFHLIFTDWSEPDTRAFIRRDRNCPSVIIWSFGNEVGEQYTNEKGAAVAKRLYDIIKEEDTTRPTTCALNFSKPDMELPKIPDIIGLNYQGEGIRQAPEFEGTERIRTAPSYDAFHAKFPNKVILSTETASAFSSRGVYLFPVSNELSAPVRDGRGGNSNIYQVSAYELHAVDFGSTADKVFGTIDRHPFVAGEFVWTGWDHLGEPTPYYESRSAYCGIIDLAGFKKDRFYLYQSHWKPEFPMAHILPHWNWKERVGKITPVHVFTSGDEVELFVNGRSLGRKKKRQYEYRLRWDSVIYEPGELKAVAYKNGKLWAQDIVKTTDKPTQLIAIADRKTINADGKDLAFITMQVTDKDGLIVPRSNNQIEFSIEGPGEIVATDNGDPTNMVSFSSKEREAFNGLCLVIIRSIAGNTGTIKVKAQSAGINETFVELQSK